MKKLNLLILLVLDAIYFVGCNQISDSIIDDYIDIEPDPIINPTSDYIVIIGDIQEYTNNSDFYPYLTYSLDWIRSQNSYFDNIKCILQLGDITNDNYDWQWDMASTAFDHLKDEVKYAWCTGNHDYAWTNFCITERESSLYHRMRLSSKLKNNIISSFEENCPINIIFENKIGNNQIFIIMLEFGPRPEVIDWALKQVQTNPEKMFILCLHEYLTFEGELVQSGYSFASQQFKGVKYTEPEYVWSNLIKPNDNIICVVCGHNAFYEYLETPNNAGRLVPQIEFNLQFEENGGNSMLMLMEFSKQNRQVDIKVYNTKQKKEIQPDKTRYSFKY